MRSAGGNLTRLGGVPSDGGHVLSRAVQRGNEATERLCGDLNPVRGRKDLRARSVATDRTKPVSVSPLSAAAARRSNSCSSVTRMLILRARFPRPWDMSQAYVPACTSATARPTSIFGQSRPASSSGAGSHSFAVHEDWRGARSTSEDCVLLDRGIRLHRRSPHFRFGDGPDGRRQIGSTPAGGAAEVAGPSRELPHPTTVVDQPDEAATAAPGTPKLPPLGERRRSIDQSACTTMTTSGPPHPHPISATPRSRPSSPGGGRGTTKFGL